MDRNNIHRCISSYKLRPRSEPTRGVVRRCSSYYPSGNRIVSFSKEHSCSYVPSLDSMSKDTISAVWFSSTECNRMKDDALRHVSAIDAGLLDVDARGLEERTAAGAWEAFQSRSQAYNLVLGLQERQKKAKEEDSHAIAEVYGEQSRLRMVIAQARAKEDEKVAQKYLNSTKLESRRTVRRVSLAMLDLQKKAAPQRSSSVESMDNWENLLLETKESLRSIPAPDDDDEAEEPNDNKGKKLIKVRVKMSKCLSELTDSTESTGAMTDESESSSMSDYFTDETACLMESRASLCSVKLKKRKDKKKKEDKKDTSKTNRKPRSKEELMRLSPLEAPKSQVSAEERASLLTVITRPNIVS
ncbi:hypothetical protein FisN_20Lh088 [Fistulifera solaris]|uniref:Uncharacterized protein n=1 Tax=Fistulifera solaris TaxID=1519565 RepID=A0A1Z5JCY3_FISSO|nr:hypothetical protein FisN_20Lh088 [Fistulifera solaris]|eukprot:GAX11855.1 hypothetical protein FisN_20Lh088 [Fistulifera solaris]